MFLFNYNPEDYNLLFMNLQVFIVLKTHDKLFMIQRLKRKCHERIGNKKCKKILLRGGLIFQNRLLCLHACSTLTHQKKGKNRKHVSEQSKTLKARDQFFLMSLMMYIQLISILAMQFYCSLKMHILESLNILKVFQEK